MEQLIQSLKDGKMSLLEVPFPALNSGCVLVRNHFSLISAGTEGKTVKDARLGYIGKARARKEEVKKVIQTAKTIGFMNTYKLVMNKLDAPSPLGYCSAGEIIEVADDITDLKPGDLVACGGASANHSEVVAVPRNLVAKIPENVSVEEASLTTLGAIAMQGVRQADLRLGESCAVIGLGLVGQLTLQMLSASGVRTIGIDIDNAQVEHARKNGADMAFNRSSEYLDEAVNKLTDGYGVDAVIITAGTSSTDPIDYSGEICRQKGKVIVVGAVPTGFKRVNYFKKELDLRMSCSYGPGRYDTEYEEKGIDYPYGYVRWTENRNMQSFLELIRSKKIKLESLITHRFEFDDAVKAYDLIVNKTEGFLGIVLKYDLRKTLKAKVDLRGETFKKVTSQEPVLGFIGAGSFAQNVLLPAVHGNASLKGIATARPANARNLADKYGFGFCSGDANDVLNDKDINTIFIATRHDSHARYVLESLQYGKNVFVEKPLCMLEEELEAIRKAKVESGKMVMVGFNRRFSPLIQTLASALHEMKDAPVAINYRVNAGVVPPDHWVHDRKTGGGRILGEACHFIDLAMFLAGSPIVSVSALAMKDPNNLEDTTNISLHFQNGSIANIAYFSNGNKDVSKEFLEVFFSGRIAVMDDFKTLKVFGKKPMDKKVAGQDKGHKAEVEAYLNAVKNGTPCPISFEEQYLSMLATFKSLKSISNNGERIFLNEVVA